MGHQFTYQELDKEGLETLVSISNADAFNRWMYETISPYLKGELLEIGSGIGNISKYFVNDGRTITLSDIRINYCNHLKQHFGSAVKNVLQLDLVHPSFELIYKDELNKYDGLFALNVVEHIMDDVQALKNALALLKPGGTILILVPAFSALYNSLDKELHHYRRYNRKELTLKMQAAGISVRNSFYFNAVGVAGWMVSGMMKNKVISGKQMSAFNAIVPIAKLTDLFTKSFFGLSVIAAGQREF